MKEKNNKEESVQRKSNLLEKEDIGYNSLLFKSRKSFLKYDKRYYLIPKLSDEDFNSNSISVIESSKRKRKVRFSLLSPQEISKIRPKEKERENLQINLLNFQCLRKSNKNEEKIVSEYVPNFEETLEFNFSNTPSFSLIDKEGRFYTSLFDYHEKDDDKSKDITIKIKNKINLSENSNTSTSELDKVNTYKESKESFL